MIRLIAAITEDFVIGKNGALPFYLADDLEHFKQTTTGRVVVMGRKTYESIGRPLPNRKNVVLSRQEKPIEGVYVLPSIEKVIAFFGADFDVIGGAEIYAEFLKANLIEEAIITHVEATVDEGVLTKFPVELMKGFISPNPVVVHEKDDNNDASFVIRHYTKQPIKAAEAELESEQN